MTRKILLLLILELSGALCIQASSAQGWSVDLKTYGFQEWHESSGLSNSSTLRLAAANRAVAVAIGNPTDLRQTDQRDDRTNANWHISLLVFDPATGKLNSKRGPWAGDRFFELFCTSQGNLLLLLRHFKGAIGEIGETLYLLSPTGNELKRLALAPSIFNSKPTWNDFLVSSSGRMALVGQVLEDGKHYRLLDADTLDIQSEWTAKVGSNSPSIIALSDKELLGLGASQAPQMTSAGDADGKLYVRTFNGPWTTFPESLDLRHYGIGLGQTSNQFAFLPGHAIVSVNAKREVSETPMKVLRIDGTTVFSPVIPKLAANTSLSGPVYVTQDGRYFAVRFAHRPWLSHLMLDVWTMDLTFQDDESVFVVWESSRPFPVAQVNLGGNVDQFSFVLGDPPSVASLSRSTLKISLVRPL